MPNTEEVLLHTVENGQREPDMPLSIPYSRICEIIDRYELAALRLKQNGLPITGKNIGSYCKPPISHPAITDALDKHAQKIHISFNGYPNKWQTIRGEFRSVINLIDRLNRIRKDLPLTVEL